MNQPTIATWVSSMVVVEKIAKQQNPDLSGSIMHSHYPLPTIEQVAAYLNEVKVFTDLDAKAGFWQVNL